MAKVTKLYNKDHNIYKHYTRKNSVNFYAQKSMAKKRGVEWKITFSEWINWWLDTGHFNERGILNDQYQMCRYNDTGPYELDNIYCATGRDNRSISPKCQIPVIATHILSGTEKHYESGYQTQFDGFSPNCVYQCCLGNQKTHRGYTFRHK